MNSERVTAASISQADTTVAHACCLCAQIKGQPSEDLISRLSEDCRYVRRVAMESDTFAIVPSLGPLAPGHVLLCPKQHFKSLACVPVEYDRELAWLRATLTRALHDLYRTDVHCFEHGTAPESSRILCTVAHAHLHLVPATVDITEALMTDGEWTELEDGLASLQSAVGTAEYLYYEAPHGVRMVRLADSERIPSQYMRRLFASALGRPHAWDWRVEPDVAQVDQAFREIQAFVQRAGYACPHLPGP
jgi:diadenosine tetraphosphate (Ap4A) HIT family hydrolase